MKKFLPVLALVACLLAPLACSQNDNVDHAGVDSTLEASPPESQRPNLSKTPSLGEATLQQACVGDNSPAQSLSMSQALEVYNGLLELGNPEDFGNALNTAGFEYGDLNELLEGIRSGAFPPKHVDGKLITFFRLYDADLAEKIADVRTAKDEEQGQVAVYYAESFANTRLIKLLDIVYQADVTSRESNIQFNVGDIPYSWHVMHNGISISHSQCDE